MRMARSSRLRAMKRSARGLDSVCIMSLAD
ncbi:Uncharacterised protein [Bordetella pertussis]|nr:Uncharacterised protein [Bordetella pertussis]